ncbi:MAG: hypothetical protein KF764_08760 [Labilithrix sp.]|nr:hypothetical protein [Labilithrix sp.]
MGSDMVNHWAVEEALRAELAKLRARAEKAEARVKELEGGAEVAGVPCVPTMEGPDRFRCGNCDWLNVWSPRVTVGRQHGMTVRAATETLRAPLSSGECRVVEGLGLHEGEWRVLGPWRDDKSEAHADAEHLAMRGAPPGSSSSEAPAACSKCGAVGGPDGELLCTFLGDPAPYCHDVSACARRQQRARLQCRVVRLDDHTCELRVGGARLAIPYAQWDEGSKFVACVEELVNRQRTEPARPGDPTVRHVVAWMRATYPQNEHAREWANEIGHVFLGERRGDEQRASEACSGCDRAYLDGYEAGVDDGGAYAPTEALQKWRKDRGRGGTGCPVVGTVVEAAREALARLHTRARKAGDPSGNAKVNLDWLLVDEALDALGGSTS